MPSFNDATPAHWAQIRATTSVTTYQLMEALQAAPMRHSELSVLQTEALDDLILAGWVIQSEAGEISLTADGLKHLKSF